MIAFWVVAIALTLAVVAALAVPLMRRASGPARGSHANSNVALYRDQLRELERDRDQGLITPEHYTEAANELAQRLLGDVPAAEALDALPVSDRRPGAWRYVALACVPLAAVLTYMVLGMPQSLEPGMMARVAQEPADHAKNLEQMTVRLAARLEANPQDAEAWVLLARSYQMLGRAVEAAKTFARAIELVPDSPQLYADYADMQVAAAGGQWTDAAMKAVAQALVLDPAHPKAMWLAGTAAYASKDFKTALSYWEKVLPLTEPGSEVQRMIQGNIDEARGLLGKAPAAAVAAAPAPVASAVPPAKPVAGGSDLSGTIALEPKIAAQLKGTETVYVFARAAQGPKMPLAIRRIRVQDLPYRFTLDDSAAMAPGMVISAFDQVVVGARVSRSGDAAPRPGDFEGYSAPVKPGTSGIVVSIGAEVR